MRDILPPNNLLVDNLLRFNTPTVISTSSLEINTKIPFNKRIILRGLTFTSKTADLQFNIRVCG